MEINNQKYWNSIDITSIIEDWWNDFVKNESDKNDYPDVKKLMEEFS